MRSSWQWSWSLVPRRDGARSARRPCAVLLVLVALLVAAGLPLLADVTSPSRAEAAVRTGPPRSDGYFHTRKVGLWKTLPSGKTCAGRVHRSTWEPRRDNYVPNHRMPSVTRVHRAFRQRPVAIGGAYNKKWDSWLLQRVTGHFTGRTDEIFQWAACKWGISDNLLRAIAVRESTWYQYDIYPSGRCVETYSCGDVLDPPTAATKTFCDMLARYGRDYQRDYSPGVCPGTFSIVGIKSWEDPSWGKMPGNQNGTFPFNRYSTAFAVDYIASQLRGCYNGWERWLDTTGTRAYGTGKMWGCVGAWYSGDWRTAAANDYISLVRHELVRRTWRQPGWPKDHPGCDPTYGCPRGVS